MSGGFFPSGNVHVCDAIFFSCAGRFIVSVRLRALRMKVTSWREVRNVRRLMPQPSSSAPERRTRMRSTLPVAAAIMASPHVLSS